MPRWQVKASQDVWGKKVHKLSLGLVPPSHASPLITWPETLSLRFPLLPHMRPKEKIADLYTLWPHAVLLWCRPELLHSTWSRFIYIFIDDHFAITLSCNCVRSGEAIPSGWVAHGGELYVWLQQLHVRLRPGIPTTWESERDSTLFCSLGCFFTEGVVKIWQPVDYSRIRMLESLQV